MDALKVSSQFAAYVWFSHGKPGDPQTQAAARRFARENWEAFLPNGHEGVGRLLIQLAQPAGARPPGGGDGPRSTPQAGCRALAE